MVCLYVCMYVSKQGRHVIFIVYANKDITYTHNVPPPPVFLLEVQYSVLKSLISTCVLSYVGSKERIGYLTESASLKRTAGIV